jgi:hypothetical protein
LLSAIVAADNTTTITCVRSVTLCFFLDVVRTRYSVDVHGVSGTGNVIGTVLSYIDIKIDVLQAASSALNSMTAMQVKNAVTVNNVTLVCVCVCVRVRACCDLVDKSHTSRQYSGADSRASFALYMTITDNIVNAVLPLVSLDLLVDGDTVLQIGLESAEFVRG